MSSKSYFIMNALIITISQSYLIVEYFKRKQFGKAASNVLAWVLVVWFLFYNYYFRVNIPVFIITCSIITVIGHFFMGNYLNYYYKSKIYDRWLHLLGAFSFSLLTFAILNNVVAPLPYSDLYTSLFVITLGISIGTLFEILEFVHDVVSKKLRCQHDLTDTDYDMLFNLFGSIIAGVTVRFL